jgi:hypothetical protein
MDLFDTLDELKPFIFRITDNGGRTADRWTVVTCDGDYYAMSSNPFSPQGVGMTGDRLDPGGLEDRVENGEERDIRWIDLPADCQRCVVDGLNGGFSDWLSSFVPPVARDGAVDSGTAHALVDRVGEGVYGSDGEYRVRREGDDPEDDLGPYPDVRAAVLATLPEEHDLSGPEYHSGVDMWDVTGGPAAPWAADEEKG